jgi:TerC family integral membrane protein
MFAGHPLVPWLAFAAALLVILAVELGVMSRIPHLTIRQAAAWSGCVIGIAALFGATLWIAEGRGHALLFATGYVIEFALSVDNLLIFIIILEYFAVPETLQPAALKWGILGAIVMRGIMIGIGAWALSQFSWVILVLGALLVLTGLKMLLTPASAPVEIDRNPVLRVARRVLPICERFEGRAFLVRRNGRLLATPLLLVVLVIEWTDVMFATDSIPAIFSITRDPFLAYTANILAIVGLRALFFLLSSVITRFGLLRYGVAAVLVLVGAKMLLEHVVKLPTAITLAGVVVVLGISVGASLLTRETRDDKEKPSS